MAKALNDLGRLPRGAREPVEASLEPGEVVHVIVEGTSGTAMVGTDRRVLVWKKKSVHPFPYEWIGALVANHAMFNSWAQVHGPSVGTVAPSLSTIGDLVDTIQLANGQKDACTALADLVTRNQRPGGPSAPEPGQPSSLARSSGMPGTEEGLLMEAEGSGGHLWLFEDRIRIKHFGLRGLVTKGFQKGDKEIALDQITAIQWREPGAMWLGHIQFTIMGGSSDTKKASEDENAVMFLKAREPEFRAIKEEIDRRRRARQALAAPAPAPAAADVPDQIRKLAELRDAGILTPEEFDAKKADLLARM